MSMSASASMRRGDYLLLVAYCVVLFAFAIGFNRSMNIHETSHCVNVQEMLRDGDWLIPHYGGRPWLERPPLPFWFTVPFVALFGDTSGAYRLAPALMAIPCVLLTAWMASLWFGRATGLLAGACLATMREFNRYSTAPECDMFLCSLITLAVAMFVHLEFQRRPPGANESSSFVGRRPWILLAFFVVLGLTNLVKGVLFGTILALLPVSCYLLAGSQPWTLIRRYVWLPGWLAYLAVGSAWTVYAIVRYPDFLDLWHSNFVGRVSQGYLAEPVWYYLANLPWILFPWSIVAVVGFVTTWPYVIRQGRTPERFLWLWAIAPVVLLSIPQGKHHHYLLHSLTPWAILSAVGMIRLWQTIPEIRWLRSPWPILIAVTVPAEIALSLSTKHLRDLANHLLVLQILIPVLVFLLWWVCTDTNIRRAALVLFLLMVPVNWVAHIFNTLRDDRYAGDQAFVQRIRTEVPRGNPVLVLNDEGPLNASWMLFYLGERGQLLHNLTFLRAKELPQGDLYLVARQGILDHLQSYGQAKVEFTSVESRDEKSPTQRFALIRIQRDPELSLTTGNVRFTAMQVAGRAPGPELR